MYTKLNGFLLVYVGVGFLGLLGVEDSNRVKYLYIREVLQNFGDAQLRSIVNLKLFSQNHLLGKVRARVLGDSPLVNEIVVLTIYGGHLFSTLAKGAVDRERSLWETLYPLMELPI